MLPSFRRHLILHLRNVSLTLCPRRKNFKLSMLSLSVMMFLLKKQQELASLFVTLKFLMFVIFFDPSPMLQCSSKSVLLIVSPLKALMEDQIYDIRKCGISRLKLHGDFPTEHDFGAEKYQILICSPESLYEESVREQLLKLQKNMVRMAVNEAHCVLQL